MSKAYPSQYGNASQYYNPDRTIPAPFPKDIPVPQWYSSENPFDWTTAVAVGPGGAIGINYTYTWSSPVYDLRPDLRSGNAARKEGVPIWTRSARMYVQIVAGNGGTFFAAAPLTVTATEFTQTTNAENRSAGPLLSKGSGSNVLSSGRYDASSQFAAAFSGQQSLLAGFAPPGTTLGFGEGYPVRYWRLELGFTVFQETGLPIPDPIPDNPDDWSNGVTPVLHAAVY